MHIQNKNRVTEMPSGYAVDRTDADSPRGRVSALLKWSAGFCCVRGGGGRSGSCIWMTGRVQSKSNHKR